MYQQQQLEQDYERWDRAVQADPTNPQSYVRRGMAHFKLGRIAASIQDFDQAEALDPRLTPYLWQRGLSYYYADRFEEGARQFEIDLTVNAHDVEETVWRYLCMAQGQGMASAQQSLLPVKHDPRRVMRSVYDLFAGNSPVQTVLTVGEQEGSQGQFYSHLYVGLYYEAMGDRTQSQEFIDRAVEQFQSTYQTNDYMGYLALVHHHQRQKL